MGNEVTCDHGMYYQFMFINYLAEKINGELKALNGSIVPTCWDRVFPAHTLDGYHLYECEDAISYETWVGL
jgi:hypothetical protein